MLLLRKLGDRAHLEYCYSFVQFETFGAMHLAQASELFEEGVIEEEEVSLLPLSSSFKVIKLTTRGRKQSKACIKLWNSFYLPSFDDPDYKLIDEYTSDIAHQNVYALSLERFQKKRDSGRLNEVLVKCPPMSALL